MKRKGRIVQRILTELLALQKEEVDAIARISPEHATWLWNSREFALNGAIKRHFNVINNSLPKRHQGVQHEIFDLMTHFDKERQPLRTQKNENPQQC